MGRFSECRTRAEAAEVYAAFLLTESDGVLWRWPEINREILARWSPSGLRWIKRRAWKIAGGE